MSYVHQHTHDQGFPSVEIILRGKAAEEYTVLCNDIAYLAITAKAVAEKLHKAVEKLDGLTEPDHREIPRPAGPARVTTASEVPSTVPSTETTEKGAHNGTDR